jgi:flagellar basal-body rod protein FlgB
MSTSLDSYLGIHTQALALEAKRNDLLAANLANVDTPNYKARDIDFKAALSAAAAQSGGAPVSGAAAAPLALDTTGAGVALGAGTASASGGVDAAALKYRVPLAPSLDGNTVDEQLEQSAFAENSVRYQATLAFLNSKFRDLMTAISSSGS